MSSKIDVKSFCSINFFFFTQAGKGRTGTIISALLLYSGLFNCAEDALNYFAAKRSINNWGVTNPSQIRFIISFLFFVNNNL